MIYTNLVKKERLDILNNKGQKLAVYLFKNNTDRLVLVVPGLIPFGEIDGIQNVIDKYYSLGNSVCYFDKTGAGESGGEKGIDLEQVVNDVRSLLEIFSKRYKKIVLYGPSLGAVPAMINAVKYSDKNIVKLIHVNGIFYFDKYLSLLQKIRILVYFALHPTHKNQLSYIKKNFKPEEVKIPVLFVVGEKDRIVNPEQSRQVFEKINSKKELVLVPDGDHLLMKKEYVPHLKRLFEWLSS